MNINLIRSAVSGIFDLRLFSRVDKKDATEHPLFSKIVDDLRWSSFESEDDDLTATKLPAPNPRKLKPTEFEENILTSQIQENTWMATAQDLPGTQDDNLAYSDEAVSLSTTKCPGEQVAAADADEEVYALIQSGHLGVGCIEKGIFCTETPSLNNFIVPKATGSQHTEETKNRFGQKPRGILEKTAKVISDNINVVASVGELSDSEDETEFEEDWRSRKEKLDELRVLR